MVKVRINGKEGTLPNQSVVVDHNAKLRYVLGADDFVIYSFSTPGNNQGINNYNAFSISNADGRVSFTESNLLSCSPFSKAEMAALLNGATNPKPQNGFSFSVKLPRGANEKISLSIFAYNNPNRNYVGTLTATMADSGKTYSWGFRTAGITTRSSTTCVFEAVDYTAFSEPVDGYRSVF